jgi:hypothetical protein
MKKLQLAPIAAAISTAIGVLSAYVIEPAREKIRRSRTMNKLHLKLFAGLCAAGMVLSMADYNPSVAAQVVSGITKANPAVVTYVGADPVSGTYIKLTGVVGMIEVNDQVFRIANVVGGSNTLELEDIDSTAFGTFVSGNMYPIEFGVSMTTVQDVNSGGGDFQFTDITTIHDALQKRIPTVSSPFTMGLGCLFKPSDAAHIELGKANRTKTTRAIRVRWATGDEAAWLAYVGASGIPTGAAQQVVKTTVSFEGQGTPNFYAA